MIKKFILLVFFFACEVSLLDCVHQENVLMSTIQQINKPISIVGFLCWDTEKTVRFARSIFEKFRSSLVIMWPPNWKDISISVDNAHQILFVADMQCDGIHSLFCDAERMLLFKPPFNWIIINNQTTKKGYKNNGDILDASGLHFDKRNSCDIYLETSGDAIPEQIRNFDLLVDSDITIISTIESEYCVYRVYKNHGEWIYEIEPTNNLSPLVLKRMNLQGAPLEVCYVITVNDSINHLEDYKDSHIDTITKVNYILTSHAIDILNGSRFSSFQNTWGYKDSNAKWNGMMGELTNHRVDLGGTPLFLTSDRISEIDYIAMPTPTRSKFVFRQPKLSYMSNVFLLPFGESIWIAMAGLIMIMVMALLIAAKVERNHDPYTLKPYPSDVILMTLGAMCQQGSNFSLKGLVGRTVILMLFLSLMFLYTSYSANIVALLQSSSSRIQTLSDLLNSRLKFAVHDTVFNRHYFSTATDPVRKAIYEQKISSPGATPRFLPLNEGVQKLREGLFAFHMEIGVGYKVVEELFYENEKCGLQEIQYLQVVDPWLAVEKNSSYKEMLKISFRRIQESGIQFRENWKLYTKKPRCTGTNSNFVSVGIVDCLPAMKLLLYGFTIVGLMLLTEIFAKRWEKRRNTDDKQRE